jgi:Zn2+/Cd2+-exporting ATPase
MAHEYFQDVVGDETGKATRKIVAVLLGGVLLLAAVAAKYLYAQPFYSGILSAAAALLLGLPLIVSAFRDLWNGRLQMDVLVALSVTAAMASGEYMIAGAAAFFTILAELIESRTALGARKAIESLVRLAPTRASRLVGEGSQAREEPIDAKDLKPGDIVRVRPGDNIPGDGVILTGSSTINQANITGESVPVEKSTGEDVFGGTINMTGVLDVKVSKAGRDTTLGRVQDLVIQASKTRTPAMRMADAWASWYIPVILMIAVIVLVFTQDINRVIALLIIACPSSIVLATPTAMVAALSAAARVGILVKNVGDFERARKLSAVVFDKTGTVTTGKLTVTRLSPVNDVPAAELLQTAVSLEQNSKHPVAKAVVDIAKKARVEPMVVTDFSEVGGKGVTGFINGEKVVVGRQAFVQDAGINTQVGDAPPEGFSVLYVARAGRLLGWVGLEDKTRPQAAQAVDELRELGLRQLVMVTGDRWSVARKVAADLHCTDVQAEVLPKDKLSVVDGLKGNGHTVAVVGDGVNDAPALAAGDLSIAMGAAGSDVAINSASIALMNSNLNRIPFLVRLSRQAGNVITQGIVFSVLFIVLFATLSAMGTIPPVVAAVLHALSSIFVVFNSARLVREGEDLDTIPEEEAQPQKQTITPERVALA